MDKWRLQALGYKNSSPLISKLMRNKIFLYRSICHSPMDVTMYSTKGLTKGDIYDIYFAEYAFSYEYEIFKDGDFYTSFMLDKMNSGESDQKFLKHFYNEVQMIQKNRDIKLEDIGL